ncbi:MAG: hypothetical protein KC912_12230 [Proteobacteria bacterium]|nr:hypothetical protein [Pseudomonadota bacterium]
MKPWLRGDLTGVDPRGGLDRLRDVVLAAAHRGEDLSLLWSALGELDAVACAELAAGPKAVPHAQSVRGCIAALDALETVLAPSGLYTRLADLAPEVGPELLAAAIERHPQAGWLIRISRRFEEIPGASILAAASSAGLEDAVELIVANGLEQALKEWTQRTANPLAAVTWLRRDDASRAAEYAAIAVDADPKSPVLAWLSAVRGPDVQDLADDIAARLTTEEGRSGFAAWRA